MSHPEPIDEAADAVAIAIGLVQRVDDLLDHLRVRQAEVVHDVRRSLNAAEVELHRAQQGMPDA